MEIKTFQILTGFIIYGIPILLAITLHEAAHGYAALQRGDTTALRMGRISLNPLRHIDLFGTVLLPAFLIIGGAPFVFGYAKPVPVNFAALRRPKQDMVYVAAAGPLTNIFLAVVSALLFYVLPLVPDLFAQIFSKMLSFSIYINVLLAVFNMLPIPPLDGGRVAVGLLPNPLAHMLAGLERWGIVIIIGSFMLLPFFLAQIGIKFNLFEVVLKPPVEFITTLIAKITGISS